MHHIMMSLGYIDKIHVADHGLLFTYSPLLVFNFSIDVRNMSILLKFGLERILCQLGIQVKHLAKTSS